MSDIIASAEITVTDVKDGVGIEGVITRFLVTHLSKGVTTSTSDWSIDPPLMDVVNKYLWSYETITYTDGHKQDGKPAIIGVYGEDGIGIENIFEYYLVSNKSTGILSTDSRFKSTIPTMNETNRYLWKYEEILYTNNERNSTSPVVVGVYGDKGTSIKNIKNYYLATSASSGITRDTDGFKETMQPLSLTNKYLWNYETIEYENPTSFQSTNPVVIGVHGEDGKDGVDAKLLYLSSTLETMSFDANGDASPTSQVATIEAKLQNTSGSISFVAKAYNGTSALSNSITLGGTGNSRTLSVSSFPSNATHVSITATLGSLTDTISIFKLRHGKEGVGGAPGQNAIVGYLTNESITLGANSSGRVGDFTPATGTFRMFDGTTEVTTITSTSYTLVNSSGLVANINSSTGVYKITAMNASTATAEFKATYKGVSIFKTVTLSKSIAGEKGDKGDTGDTGPKGATGSQGPRGAQGTSVESVVENYLVTNAKSGVTTSTSGWGTTLKTMTSTDKYLWNYERINFSDGTFQNTIPVIMGVYGDTGQQGPQGNTGGTGPQGPEGRAITNITEHYLASTASSGVTRSTSGWSTSMQSTDETKRYLWNYETITWSKGTSPTYSTPIIIGVHGAKGDRGPQGPQGATGSRGPIGSTGTSVESITEYYLATSASKDVTTGTDGWKTDMQKMTPTNKYLWNYEKINFSNNTSQPTIPVIIGVYGDKGQTGGTGATGRSIVSITEHYLVTSANSGVTRSTSGWDTKMKPTTETSRYLWNYETVNWSSGTTPTYVEPIIIGVHGAKGPQGAQGPQGATGSQGPRGNTGTSVVSITEYYLATSVSSGIQSSNKGFTTAMQPLTATNKYLWNYEKVNFSDNTSQPTIPVIIGVYGDKGQTGSTGATGATGRSITSITEHYLATSASTGVTRTTSGWSTAMKPTTETNKYLWNYETVNWSSGTTPTYVEPIIIGVHGAKGDAGADAISGVLTNESITFAANSSGNIATQNYVGNTGNFLLMEGAINRSSLTSVTYSRVSQTNVNATISSNGAYTVSSMTGGTSVTAGQVTFRATYKNTTIDKTISISKSIAGQAGSPGGKGDPGAPGGKGDPGAPGAPATSYWLTSSSDTVTMKHDGDYDPKVITFYGHSKTGTSNATTYAGRFIIQTSTNGTSYTQAYISNSNQSSYAFTIPSNVSFVKAKFYQAGGTTYLLDEQTVPVLRSAENLEVGGRNLLVQSTITRGRYLNSDGTSTSLGAWFHTDYIPVAGYTKLITSGYTNLGISPAVVYYNSSKAFVKGINNAGASRAKDITIDPGIAYIRFSGEIKDLPTLKIEKGNIATDWTPAPEDVEASIGEVDDKATDAKDKTDAWSYNGTTEIDGTSIKTGTLEANKITTGTLKSQNNNSWINLNNGEFNFAKGGLVYSGGNLTLNGKLSVTNLDGKLTDSQIGSAGTWNAKETTTGAQAKANAAEETATIFARTSAGKLISTDPLFQRSSNGFTIYNNSNNGNVTVTREHVPTGTQPGGNPYRMRIRSTGAASPNWGGFIRAQNSRANAEFVIRFTANIPSGRTINEAKNAIGNNSVTKWLTSRAGTGNWQEYAYYYKCGSSGTFSNFGHVYLTGGSTPTASAPLTWYVSKYEMIDISDSANPASLDDLRSSGKVTIHGGNITADTLDVNKLTGNKANFVSTAFNSISSNLSIDAKGLKITTTDSWDMNLINSGIQIVNKNGKMTGKYSALVSGSTKEPTAISMLVENGYNAAIGYKGPHTGNTYSTAILVNGTSGQISLQNDLRITSPIIQMASQTIYPTTGRDDAFTIKGISGGGINFSVLGGRTFEMEAGKGLKIKAGAGYVDINPSNTTYAHLDTNRSYFLFEKPVRVTGTIMMGTYANNRVATESYADSIISIGSNTNGEWIRYKDGTQICWKGTLFTPRKASIKAGNVYTTEAATWTFPQSFIIPPVLIPTAWKTGTTGGMAWGGHDGGMSEDEATGLKVITTSSIVSGIMQPVAIGRWKK